MSKNKKILLRVQSPEGTKRVEVGLNEPMRELYEATHSAFDLKHYDFAIYKERSYTNELVSSSSKTISQVSLKHGDMIYMKTINDNVAGPSGSSSSTTSIIDKNQPSTSKTLPKVSSNSSIFPSINTTGVLEDEVDQALYKIDGRIDRGRDSKLCRHNSNGCCVHCSPLEPWDENYLKEQKIKHLSFHSYLRKLTSGVDRGKFVALEDVNCKIKTGCKEHPPWPKGICSKCQPSAITLNRQIYRHVDNVMFENPIIVERFLNYWRSTGHQRLGIMYGAYEQHTDVPLGIRARVAAIYEPPQESTRDSIKLLSDDHAKDVDELASGLGLKKVGWIFTDLISDNPALGTVKQVRGIETHFLTAHECIMAGHYQNQNPNICKYASNEFFGSKFVTVCVTGDASKSIHMEGYQVSSQCMALVRDNCLVPTKDASELGYIRESSDKQFVPDVYYKEKDIYGNEVSRLSRPLPVEYLLVDVPASTPKVPLSTFTATPDGPQFQVENRFIDGHLQDFDSLTQYLAKWKNDQFLDAISDFHLLLYLSRMDMLPMKKMIGPLLEAVRNKDRTAVYEWRQQEIWRTLETLIHASSSQEGSDFAGTGGPIPTEANWTCQHCTFINQNHDNCEICGLPRNG